MAFLLGGALGASPRYTGALTPTPDEAMDTATCVKMDNHWNAQYTLPVMLGTPSQKLEVVPDTGSFSLVLVSTLCTDSACQEHARFDVNSSSTYLDGTDSEFTIEYGQGSVLVHHGKDVVRFGSTKRDNISLLLMRRETLEYFGEAAYDGVLGLGHRATAESGASALLTEYGVSSFGICLGQADGAPGRLDLSQDIDALKSKYTTQLHVVGQIHWGVSLQGISVGGVPLYAPKDFTAASEPFKSDKNKTMDEEHDGDLRERARAAQDKDGLACGKWEDWNEHGEEISGKGCGAIVDSGTSLLTVPSATFDALYEAIGEDALDTLAMQDECKGEVYDSLPTISFKLDGHELKMEPAQYMGTMEVYPEVFASARSGGFMFKLGKTSSQFAYRTACIPLLTTIDTMTDHGPLVIIGVPFFRAFSVQFERLNKKIRLAPVAQGSTLCAGCNLKEFEDEAAAAAAAGASKHDAIALAEQAKTPQPVKVRSDKLRLPWWAVNPVFRKQSMTVRPDLTDGVKPKTPFKETELANSRWRLQL
jgi:hypothetical protein